MNFSFICSILLNGGL